MSSNSGSKLSTRKKKLAKNTCKREKKVNRLLMLLLHKIATGMLRSSIPKDTEKENPKKAEVIFSIKNATPVKPLESRLMGTIKICMTAACIKPASRTLAKV